MPIWTTHMGVELKTRNQEIRARNLLNAFRRQGILEDEVYIEIQGFDQPEMFYVSLPYTDCLAWVEDRRGINPLEDTALAELHEMPHYSVHENPYGVMELCRYMPHAHVTAVLIQSPKYAPAWDYATFIARNYRRRADKRFGSAK